MMKNKITKMIRFGLVALSLLMFTIAAIQTVGAATKQKKSEKLQKKMTQVVGTDFIDVIVKPTAAWTSGLTTALNGKGAMLKKDYSNFAFKVYKIKRVDIDLIAGRSDVDFMTLDDTVKTLGHLTATTGADGIRTLNGTTNQIEGDGIGIVVVDSGVDTLHSSLKTKDGSATRVIFSQDFTGENRTDDVYGHGTHVAAMAAGNHSVSQGAYQGIAPTPTLSTCAF